MARISHRWGPWLLIAALLLLIAYQPAVIGPLRSAGAVYERKVASMFPYAFRRAAPA